MDKDLERKIGERRQEAQNKKIYEKARMIAQVLGWRKRYIDDESGEIYTYGFVCNPFEIKVEGLVTCLYNNKKVFSGDPIECYIPGEWETKLEELYLKAVKTKEEQIKESLIRKEKQRIEEEKELRRMFGLD
ncbi:hypothetical protein HYX19_00435 [Candidatus Woesearchaeota archaeon]|nr:hypothetical protein [Candidatus Woesearchaeota archaeon]